MSVVTGAKRHGRFIFLIGLDRTDIDHLIGGDVVHLKSRMPNVPDLAVFAGETGADLEATIMAMTSKS
jgi:hypothetical protein